MPVKSVSKAQYKIHSLKSCQKVRASFEPEVHQTCKSRDKKKKQEEV